jgi:DNA-binding response OmpR family regulator
VKQFRILVVEDDQRIRDFITSKLKASGYDVLTANNGVEGLEQAHTQEPDLVVLDLLMPKMDGLEMLKQLRSVSAVPVIFLTAKGADTDRIRGLELGADDYLPKPFHPDELVARVTAVLRRAEPGDQRKAKETISLGSITIDFKKHTVTVRGQEQYLTRTEWFLLNQLASNTGRLMSYEDLLCRVWGPEYRDDVQLLRTCISRLRTKLEDEPDNPKLIRTIPRTGYILEEPLI